MSRVMNLLDRLKVRRHNSPVWRETLTESAIHIAEPGAAGALRLADKWTLIDSLHRALCLREQLTEPLCAEIINELNARERLMSTGIGEQMAIPHAVVPGCDRFMTECAIIRQGIDFDSIDNGKVYIVVMLVAPKSALQEHLKVMAEIARVFYQPEIRQKVIAAPDAAEIVRLIRNDAA